VNFYVAAPAALVPGVVVSEVGDGEPASKRAKTGGEEEAPSSFVGAAIA